MAKANIELTDQSENDLKTIEKIGILNDVPVKNKEQQINLAINIAAKCIDGADNETIENLTNLKKSF